MQLSLHADYALRVLVYAGAHQGRKVTTTQISQAYGISQNHLVRVVATLGKAGYLEVTQGRSGGISLAKDPSEIRLGQVVRDSEVNLKLVECFDRHTNTCPIIDVCSLKSYLHQALHAFLRELDTHTLADVLARGDGERLAQILVPIAISRAAS